MLFLVIVNKNRENKMKIEKTFFSNQKHGNTITH